MNSNERRIKKVIARSVIIDLVFYVSIALAGYFSTFEKTDKIVLDRGSIDGSKDYLILIA